MDFAKSAIDRRTLTLVLTTVMLVVGYKAFNSLSRLEDPEFTIKDALVITPYPGASAIEVEEEVTDELEKAVQQLSQLKKIESRSVRGISTLTVTIKDKYDKDGLPQVWDELRRKVGDAQSSLPPGAGPSVVIDDYGDVFGIFVAIYGEGFSYADLKEVVDLLRRELLLVEGVAKIDTYGERTEAVYVELDRDRLAQLGIPESKIIDELRQKNLVADSGRVHVGTEFITLNPTGGVDSVEEFESILIGGSGERQIYLRDVAQIRRGYIEPQGNLIRYDGNAAIAIGISTVAGGNVVKMGEALGERMQELLTQVPLGIEFGLVSMQSDAVKIAIKSFTGSLLQAVAIVVLVLLFFMGLRSGLLIGFILLLTISGTFIFLQPMGVALERISLGALIIALGMLVDNAIVIVDGILVRLQRGEDAKEAASKVVKQSATPLLGATIIAILAFAAIGTSQDSTGEFCRSLYQVVLTSLLLSWVTAVTVTPLLCVMFLKGPKPGTVQKDPYDSGFYHGYKGFLGTCIRMRWVTVAVVAALFAGSVAGFGYVKQSFFPPSTRPQFMVDVWSPQGTHIDDNTAVVAQMEEFILALDGVTHISSLVGQGGMRFLLTYAPEKQNSAYSQLLVDVEDPLAIPGLIKEIEGYVAQHLPDVQAYGSMFQLGPGSTGKVQARFMGEDPDVLRRLATETEAILHADPDSKAVRTDWRGRVKVLQPRIAETQANLNGITRSAVAAVLKQGFQGVSVGVYRDGDLLLPIIMRAPERDRSRVESLRNLQIWSPAAQTTIPLRQVVSGFETTFEDEIIIRRDRKRTLTVFADPDQGMATELFARVRPQIEALDLPPGYELEWGGEYEDSANAQAGLTNNLPKFILMMLLVTVALFNSVRLPLVIWLCVPLALIGVTTGLLSTGQPFGFMALLGFLSLIGMLLKNAIVLVDQIQIERAEGRPPLEAILESGVSRLRPVSMAAATTALGLIPLLFDAFFVSMAVTIIFGLMVATVLTMVVLPVFYAIIFRVGKKA